MDDQREQSGRMRHYWSPLTIIVLVGVCGDGRAESWDGNVSQHGEMRLVLGQGRHEGRIRLGDLTERQHCYAVGALAHLAGEVTVFDGKIVATLANEVGGPITDSGEPEDKKATMLVAAYVTGWDERRIANDVAPEALERFLRGEAEAAGLDVSKPFPFVIEGDLRALEMHVINGACPMRAKRLGRELPAAQQPYHGSIAQTAGHLVGIYAAGAAHRLTHHGTETHTHVLLKDKQGRMYTGHVERVGVGAGAVLRLPVR